MQMGLMHTGITEIKVSREDLYNEVGRVAAKEKWKWRWTAGLLRKEGEREKKRTPSDLARKLPSGAITERGHRRRSFHGLNDKLALGAY